MGSLLVALSLAAYPSLAAAQSLVLNGREDGRVDVVDLETLTVTASFETGAEPHELAARPGAGLILVPSYGAAGITEIDLVSGETRVLAEGFAALHDIALGPGLRTVWVTAEEEGAILELDGRSGAVVRRWTHGLESGHMVAASPGGAILWVPDLAGGGVARIDRRTGEIRTIPIGSSAEGVAVAPDGSEVWVTGVASNEVVVLDSLGTELARMPSGGEAPVKLRLSPDGTQVWVSNNQSRSVAVFDRVTRAQRGTVVVGPRPLGIGFSEDGALAYVTRPGAAEVVEIDTSDLRILRRIPAPARVDGVAWIPDLPVPDSILRIPSDDAELFAEFHLAALERPHGLILLFHQGGASARAEYRNVIPWLEGLGWNVLSVDLREGGDLFGGTNRTVRQLSEAWDGGYCAVYPDVEAALAFARTLPSDLSGGHRIVGIGSSYSGALALQLAGRRGDELIGVAVFSPASGPPLAGCRGPTFTADAELPILVVRPEREAALPSVAEELVELERQGHETWIARPGIHGASMLDPARTEGAEDTRAVLARWLLSLSR